MKYTKKVILAAHKKCTFKGDFRQNFQGEYDAAGRMRIRKELMAKLISKPKGRAPCTEEKARSEARKYTTKIDFKTSSPGAYKKAIKLGILQEITSHMIPYGSPKRRSRLLKWTVELVLKEAAKHETRQALYKSNKGAYQAAYKLGISDRAFAHMTLLGNKERRCVYGIFFPGRKVYFGLTQNFLVRKWQHGNTKTNKNILNEGGLKKGIMVQITDYIPREDARLLEGKKEEEYKGLVL